MSSNKNKHCTLNERKIIETGIINGSTKASITETIGKEKSTVGKEIKLHRVLSHKCSYPVNCANFSKCKLNRMCTNCLEYIPFSCKRRDRSPGACNGCEKLKSCKYDKYMYHAEDAQDDYKENLIDSRLGVNMTYEQAKEMADVVVPLIKQGQSPYVIVTNHPELDICEKPLYNYIESGIFANFGLSNIDLRLMFKRRMPKDKAKQYKNAQTESFSADANTKIIQII